MPFFSVVIPLFNKENYIEETLTSVLNQTFKDFEIIVINDGSSDNSLVIAEKVLSKKTNCRILTQKNKGLSATRNEGIKESKGEIIAFLDADDTWLPSFLSNIYSLFKKFPEASLYGTSYLLKYSDTVILEAKKNIDKKIKNTQFLVDDFFKANIYHPIVCQSSIAAKKTVFEKLSFDETINLSEDIDFYIKSNLKYRFAYCNSNSVIILQNIPDQITGSGIQNKTIPNLDLYEEVSKTNSSLKKYLDFYRFTFLIQYRLENDFNNSKLLLSKIDLKNLTLKQRILVKSPILFLKAIKALKQFLLKRNIRRTSF